jgi:hypothetical protein
VWRKPVGEYFLWLLPLVLALTGHAYASTKASMTDHGPGFHIELMNERTQQAQATWHFLAQHWYLFAAYGILLLVLCLALKRLRVPWYARALVLIALALPSLWYFALASYLGSKMLAL